MLTTTTTLSTLLLALSASTTALTIPSLTPRAAACTPSALFFPPSGHAKFELLALPISSGNYTLGGTYVQAYHSTIGQAVTLLTNDQSLATVWHFDEKLGNLYFNSPVSSTNNKTVEAPNTLVLYNASLPTNYPNQILGNTPAAAMEVGTQLEGTVKQGFSFDTVTNTVSPPCGTFSACYLHNAGPYGAPGAELVWSTAGLVGAANCVDVQLKAVDSF